MHLLFGRSVKYVCCCILLISIFFTSLTLYICSNRSCSFYQFNFLNSPYYAVRWRKLKANRQILSNRTYQTSNFKNVDQDLSNGEITVAKADFNIKGSDVIVFLHIQNTGGSVFARHIVEDLKLERPCRCKKNRRICRCYRPNNYGSTWFFSRYTTGWKCGVHPDWSELSTCVDRVMDEDEGKPVKRRYFFMTMLRDPVKRFLSEFWHVRQGQTWSSSRHWCSGVEATSDELPPCFELDDLNRLTLENFIKCEHNLAINRQARMLSDLSLVGCYNSSSLSKEDRDLIILTSAKNNLHKMSFFGLSEFPKVSQYMFETTFGLKFRIKKTLSHDFGIRSARKELFKEISVKDIENIKRVNYLDTELYYYAKELLFFRFEKLKKADPSFKNYFDSLAKSNLSTENWADKEDILDNLLD